MLFRSPQWWFSASDAPPDRAPSEMVDMEPWDEEIGADSGHPDPWHSLGLFSLASIDLCCLTGNVQMVIRHSSPAAILLVFC